MAAHQLLPQLPMLGCIQTPAKYAGDKTMTSILAAKIKAGGAGVWGEDMMPPQPHVSDANAKIMAELIMALKPAK